MQDRPRWILIVEGEESAGENLKMMLVGAGYKVLTCSQCSRSHQILQNQKFDCVVVDHDVKGSCGVSVITPIKKNAYHLNHNTPFILMGENLDPGILRRIATQIEAAFVKPLNEETLVNKVKSIVGKHAA